MNSRPKLSPDQIKARLRSVCICKGIKMGTICDAIAKKGLKTVEEVNCATGSGSGGCGATRCRPVITVLLESGGVPLPLKALDTLQQQSTDELDEW